MSGDLNKLPFPVRNAITLELMPQERVLYAAQPDWRGGTGPLLSQLLFGIGWSVIVFWLAAKTVAAAFGIAWDDKPNPDFASPSGPFVLLLFLVPFVAIGVVFLISPFRTVAESRRTVHVVTDARLLSIIAGPKPKVESITLASINFIRRRDRSDGAGNVEVGYGVETDSDGDPRPLTVNWYGIPNVKRAETAMRENARWVR